MNEFSTFGNTETKPTLLRATHPSDEEAGATDGQWLPGLTIHRAGAETLCHTNAATLIARGTSLAEALEALQQGQADTVEPKLIEICRESGCWVARTTTMSDGEAQAWAEIGVSPAQGRATAQRHSTWHWTSPKDSDQFEPIRGALNGACSERSIALESTPGEPTAMQIATGSMLTTRSEAHWRELFAASTRARGPWAIVLNGWMGTVCVSSGPGGTGACARCAKQRIQGGPWVEVANYGVGTRWTREWTGQGPTRAQSEAIATHLLQCAAGNHASTTLREWREDEPGGRAPETIIALPECSRCARLESDRSSNEALDATEQSRRTLMRAAHASGPWTGLHAQLAELRSVMHEGRWGFTWHTLRSARTRSGGALRGFPGLRESSAGKGASRGGARAGAIAEAIERYALSWRRDADDSTIASMDQLRRSGQRFVSPERLLPFSERQWREREAINDLGYAWLKIPGRLRDEDDATQIAWTAGRDLANNNTRTLTPRSWMFMNTPSDWPEGKRDNYERFVYICDTNGVAAGPTKETAIARGYCEIVERDGIALWWYNRLQRPRIDPDRLDDAWIAQAPKELERIGRTLTLLDASVDRALPVVIAVSVRMEALSDGGWEPLVTAGCGPGITVAAQRAIAEQVQIGPRHGAETPFYAKSGTPEFDTMRWWKPAEEPWLTGSRKLPALDATDYPHDERTEGEAFLERVMEYARRERTSLIVRELTHGYGGVHVTKTCVPERCHFWHRLGDPRLSQTPVDLGWSHTALGEDAMNPVPIPL